ncbi:hypothetical protein ACVWZD_000934 [Streptomyces sp. TE3672]
MGRGQPAIDEAAHEVSLIHRQCEAQVSGERRIAA